MDIAGAVLYRLLYKRVDKPDDRRAANADVGLFTKVGHDLIKIIFLGKILERFFCELAPV